MERLLAYWRTMGVLAAPACSREALDLFEDQHRLLMPTDFREYLSLANGMALQGQELGRDENGFSFWPLERLDPVSESGLVTALAQAIGVVRQRATPEQHQYFVFADYLHWSWAYAIGISGQRSSECDVIRVGGRGNPLVARTFGAFVDLYLSDASALYVA
jgi:hypothetical protein